MSVSVMRAASTWRRALALCALAVATLLTGCASGPLSTARDPLEPLNRQVYAFNEGADQLVVKPVATLYREGVPDLVRTGVNNFFSNLGDAWSAVNSALQLRVQDAAENLMRFSVNSVFGLAGVLDIASEANIDRHPADFGSTLARWGVPPGPYLVLPLMGPSTLRDASGVVIDRRFDPLREFESVQDRNTLNVVRLIDTRSNLLRATDLIEGVALDKYSFVRDVYLQRRGVSIEDPPPTEPAGGGQNPTR
ncbi:MAG: MlaA family lipoprotein [Burkholderiaceae bacterium]|jgi:phospholipid-binding lipoprotein MlaA